MSDIFGIQDEVCAAIVGSLREKLTTAADYTPSRRPTHNIAAYDAYLKGTFHLNRLMASDLRRGAALLEEATRADPEFTLALVGLSVYYSTIAIQGYAPSSEVLPRAEDLARRALQVESTTSRGSSRLWSGAAVPVGLVGRRGRTTSCDNPATCVRPGVRRPRIREEFAGGARPRCPVGEQAVALEPLDPMFGWFLTQSLCLAGDLERAVAQGRATMRSTKRICPRTGGLRWPNGNWESVRKLSRLWHRHWLATIRWVCRCTPHWSGSSVYRGGAFHRPRAREEAAGRVDCWRSPRRRLERCRDGGSRTGLAGILSPGARCQLDSPAGALVRPAAPGPSVPGCGTSHRRPYAGPCCRCLGLSNDVEHALAGGSSRTLVRQERTRPR